MLTLVQAATMTGMNRSSILRAIKLDWKKVALTGLPASQKVWTNPWASKTLFGGAVRI
jgi:hypothetical protein